MKMSRFFRKYSRTLLLVFMSLLLVVFLIGDVVGRSTRGPARLDVELGRVFGRPVRLADLHRAEVFLRIQSGLGLPIPLSGDESDSVQRWLDAWLLFEEARQVGIRIGKSQVLDFLAQNGITAAHVDALRTRLGVSMDVVYEAVGAWMASNTLASFQLEALGGSLPRTELAFRDARQQADVTLAVIDARALLPHVPPPTEEELLEHFQACRDRVTAHTADELVYGYRLADRVALEYLTVDPDALRSQVRVREKEARQFYEDHKALYVETLAPTTQPGQPPAPRTVQRTYEEVKERVREDARRQAAIAQAQRWVNDLQAEAARPWHGSGVGPDGFRIPPPPEQLVSLEALAGKYAGAVPLHYERTGLSERSELAAIQGLAQATYLAGTQRIGAVELAFRVKGLYQPGKDETLPVLNIGEPSPVLLDHRSDPFTGQEQPYQAYFFVVHAVAPSGPPESLEVVREKVTEDLRHKRAFELARQAAERLGQQARQSGLAQAVAEATELRSWLGPAGPQTAQSSTQPAAATQGADASGFLARLGPKDVTLGRTPAPIADLGVVPQLHERVFELADQEATTTEAAWRVVVVPAPAQLQWIVAQLKTVRPLYAAQFARERDALARGDWGERLRLIQEWFDPSNIRQRTGYVASRPLGSEP